MYILIIVNTATTEFNRDMKFDNVDDMLRYVNETYSNTWTSLVVTILPRKEAGRG